MSREDHPHWETGGALRVNTKRHPAPQGPAGAVLSPSLQGAERECLPGFCSSDASPACSLSLSCAEDTLPGSLAPVPRPVLSTFFRPHGIWRHNSHLLPASGFLKHPRGDRYRTCGMGKGTEAHWRLNFNCRDDLMVSRQKVRRGTC